MNAQADLERRVIDWLRAEAPERAPERILSATLDRVAVVGQQRSLPTWRQRDDSGNSRLVLIAATAVLLTLIAAGAVFVGSRLLPEVDRLPIPPPAPAVRVPGQGPTLAWTRSDVLRTREVRLDETTARVAWVKDRFVLADEKTQTVAVSADGSTWTTLTREDPEWDLFRVLASPGPIAIWEDEVVSWTPDVPGAGVRIRRPPDATFEADFEGTVDAVGVGARGIVVKSQTEFDQDGFLRSVLGPGWSAEELVSISLEDGVVTLANRLGRTASVDLAEHGVAEADFANRGEGWHSVDGTRWTPIPEFPGNVFAIVGSGGGFYARGHDAEGPGMWHSEDGLLWRRLPYGFDLSAVWSGDPALLHWAGTALHSNGANLFESWTIAGRSDLPMSAELPSGRGGERRASPIGVGRLGIVSVDTESGEILFTPDGVEWRIQEMSQEMARAGRLDRHPHATSVAVGTGAVVVLLWEGSSETGVTPSLWVGTITP